MPSRPQVGRLEGLETSWPSWVVLEAKMGLKANLGASWRQLGRFRCQLGGLGGNFARFGGFYKSVIKNN